MISKKARQGRILEIGRSHSIRSQEELLALLEKEGIRVTQATLSRDIRDLGLVKVRGAIRFPAKCFPARRMKISAARLRSMCCERVFRTTLL